ncbi:MAG: phosphopantetheine-binding protein [Eubacteriales bacterium]|nr:phosphopantetheine-binding protein [Eubacteriales bacterium]
MEKKEIISVIAAQMNELFGIKGETVTEDSALMEDLGLSSFDMLLLLPEIENKFGVEFSAGSLRSMITVGDISDYIIQTSSQSEKG